MIEHFILFETRMSPWGRLGRIWTWRRNQRC